MQKLGQHFLKNAVVLQTIVRALALAEGDRVIEIGPGHGELTAPLVLAAQGKRCEIFCIEKDHVLIDELKLFVARENAFGRDARVNILEGDALRSLPEVVATRMSGGAGYKIVGNIPYYITGKLLRTMSELERKPERAVLLLQKEVAERICATPPTMNRLAASVQFWADAAIVTVVPRKDFSPPPEVDSAVIILKNRAQEAPHGKGSVDPALYYRAVRGIFAQPRKTLLNNLSEATIDNVSKADIIEQLKKIGVDPAGRPQDLAIKDIVAIAEAPLWG